MVATCFSDVRIVKVRRTRHGTYLSRPSRAVWVLGISGNCRERSQQETAPYNARNPVRAQAHRSRLLQLNSLMRVTGEHPASAEACFGLQKVRSEEHTSEL